MDAYDRDSVGYADRSHACDLEFLRAPFCAAVPVGGRLLDLGSGAGRDSLAFSAKGFRVISLDRSMGLLKQHLARGHGTLVRGDLRRLPFRDASFDGIWACASFLHVAKSEIACALRGAHRVLVPEGLLWLSVKEGEGEFTDEDGRLWSFYREDELLAVLVASGFSLLWHGRSADRVKREASADTNGPPWEGVWITLLARACPART